MYLNLGNPVNFDHPINRGRDFWLSGVEGFAGRGATWYSLFKRDLYPATLSSVDWATGVRPFSYALNCNATRYASLASSTTLDYSRNFTLAATVKYVDNGGYQSIMSHGVGGFYFRITNGDKLNFLKSNTADIQIASTSLVSGNTYRVMVTLDDQATANGVIYLNGVSDASFTTALTFDGNSGILIGSDMNAPAELNAGYITDVSTWSRALTAAEVYKEYRDWVGGYKTLLNWYTAKTYFFGPAATASGSPWYYNAQQQLLRT